MSLKSTQYYQYGNRKINYTLVKSKRRKTSELIVDKDEIIIRAPFDKSLPEIEKILDDKISWIIKKQREYEDSTPEIISPTFLPDSTVPYFGKNYTIKIILRDKEEKQNSIEIVNDNLVVFVEAFDIHMKKDILKNKILYLYNKWLNQKAKEIFIIKINKYSKIIGVHPPKK